MGELRENYLREIRKAKGLTAVELGRLVGCSGPNITKIENRQTGITTDMLYKLSEALDVLPNEIMEGPDTVILARDKKEEALIHIFRKMDRRDQKRFVKMAETMLDQSETPDIQDII